jgi:predicted O-methyltransferase YrrM
MDFSNPAIETIFERLIERHEQERMEMRRLRAAGKDVDVDNYLLPVGPNVARFLHSLVLSQRPETVLEVGTSYGYSTLVLADAVSQTGSHLITIELTDYKQEHARELIVEAGLSDSVTFRCGDAVEMINSERGPFNLVLLDVWKSIYVPCLEALYPKLADEGIVIADNMIEPATARDSARTYRNAVRNYQDLQTTLIPIGSGIELSVRWPAGHAKL